jgi:hypothetical protein
MTSRWVGRGGSVLAISVVALGCSAMDGRTRELTMPADLEKRAYDEPDKAAEFYLRKRLPDGVQELPVEKYFAAMEQMRHMPQYSLATLQPVPSRAQLESEGRSYIADAAVLGSWQFLGPQNIGGRVRALVIHPTQPNILWAAAVGGGVWKSTNGGAAWLPLSDLLPNIAVNSLAIDPANPNVLYAGTGEGYGNSDAIRGAGVFRTTDGGATWTRLTSTNNSNFHFVNDILVSKGSSQRLYAATKTGVWRSLNGGGSWTRVLNPNVLDGCTDLVISTKVPDDVVLAACGIYKQASVWRNTRAQATGAWAKVLTETGMGRTALALAPSNQSIVYALAASMQPQLFGALHAVFRSAASGAPGSWTAQTRTVSANPMNKWLLTNPISACQESQPIHQGWYDNVIAVDPKNANRVWAGGIDLFRSDDGGRNWGLASYWWSTEEGVPAQLSRAYVHADQHAIAFHPQYNGTTNKAMFVANDGGVFMTSNATAAVATSPNGICNPSATKLVWVRRNSLGNTQFYHGAVFPDGSAFLGGTQDNGTNYSQVGFPAGWLRLLGGDGGHVAIGSSYYFAELPGLSIQRSQDADEWELITDGIDEDPMNFLFIAPFAIDPFDGERLVIGGRRLWQTNDSGDSWESLSGDLTSKSISAVGIVSGAPIAGTSDGFLSTPAGHVRPRQGFVSSVALDPSDLDVGYATFSTFGGVHVWKTTNYGETWQPLDGVGAGRLPDLPVHSIVVDPVNPQWLYIGTDMGVFLTIDGGTTWAIENTGFPNVVVESLAINSDAPQYLFAFTHGRSAWRVALPD